MWGSFGARFLVGGLGGVGLWGGWWWLTWALDRCNRLRVGGQLALFKKGWHFPAFFWLPLGGQLVQLPSANWGCMSSARKK
jgi:hypothetical protein